MKDILIDRSSRPSAKRLSVIIPSFNRVGDLKNALDSLVAQSVKDFDVFVSDDGSTDDNEGLVKSYREKLDIT